MAARFVALPVGQGDAFLFERGERRALVDGGKSSTRIIELLVAERVEHLDVVVCTHNDKDHAGGVAGLLESERFSVGEVWLPGRWSERLLDLCRNSADFARELSQAVTETDARTLADVKTSSDPRPSGDSAPPSDVGSAEAQILAAVDSVDDGTNLSGAWAWRAWPRPHKNWELWIESLTAADRIRRIAKATREVGARLRWFDYEEFRRCGQARGGMAGFLVSVNAVEITPRAVRRKVTALDFLSLSVANRESLVFHAPGGSPGADVLFTADSDLAFALPAMSVGLVTAPHHGSDANQTAYAKVAALGARVTWVRSDGRFMKRPGAEFLKNQAAAFCTRCRGATSAGQAVRFVEDPSTTSGPSWNTVAGTAACHCV